MKRSLAVALIVLSYSLLSSSQSAARGKHIPVTDFPVNDQSQDQAGRAFGGQQRPEPAKPIPTAKQPIFLHRHRKGFHVIPDLSWGVSNLKFKGEYASRGYSAEKRQALQFGLDVAYMFGAHGGLGIGCRAESFGYHAISYARIDNKVTQSYFSVPVYARFISSKSRTKKPGFFANIGFTYHTLTSITDEDRAGGKYTSMDGYRSNVWSFQVCAGQSIPVSRQVSIDAAIDYQYFLSNNFDIQLNTSVKGHLHAFSGRVGVDVRITK